MNSISRPIPSMYGIFIYIWLIYMVNVGKYTIHGCYGDDYFLSPPQKTEKMVVFSLKPGKNKLEKWPNLM